MDIDYLKELLVFSESLNYTVAAKELFIAQPTLSQHIAKMSAELGVPLVTQAKRAHLTPAGDLVTLYARQIVELYSDMQTALAHMKASAHPDDMVMVLDINNSMPVNAQIEQAIASARAGEAPGGAKGETAGAAGTAVAESGAVVAAGVAGAAGAVEASAPFSVRYSTDGALFKQTPFALLDNNDVDVSFAFAPAEQPDLYSGKAYRNYRLLPLRPVKWVFLMAKNHPAVHDGKIALGDLARMRLLTVKTPFWLDTEESVVGQLRACGANIRSDRVNLTSKFSIIEHDFNYVAATFADVVEGSLHGLASAVTAATVEGHDFFLQPYAICRKDNPNKAVDALFDAWAQTLSE